MNSVNDIEFIFACAGHSTRNYPQSKGIPHKSFMPFASYRLIDHFLKDIFELGGRNITFIVSNEESVHAFKKAFADDKEIREKLKEKGRYNIVKVMEDVAIPEDVNIKYVIQHKPLGTAQCLALAHEVAPDKHGIMIFPDDIWVSKDRNNSYMKKLINNFLENPKRSMILSLRREDVSNNAILMNGRVIEKPKNPTNNLAGISPVIIPVEIMKHIYEIMPEMISNGKEWYHMDGVNHFLDNVDDKNYKWELIERDEGDIYLDTGNRSLYEKGLLISLLTLSEDKEEHLKTIREFIK